MQFIYQNLRKNAWEFVYDLGGRYIESWDFLVFQIWLRNQFNVGVRFDTFVLFAYITSSTDSAESQILITYKGFGFVNFYVFTIEVKLDFDWIRFVKVNFSWFFQNEVFLNVHYQLIPLTWPTVDIETNRRGLKFTKKYFINYGIAYSY